MATRSLLIGVPGESGLEQRRPGRHRSPSPEYTPKIGTACPRTWCGRNVRRYVFRHVLHRAVHAGGDPARRRVPVQQGGHRATGCLRNLNEIRAWLADQRRWRGGVIVSRPRRHCGSRGSSIASGRNRPTRRWRDRGTFTRRSSVAQDARAARGGGPGDPGPARPASIAVRPPIDAGAGDGLQTSRLGDYIVPVVEREPVRQCPRLERAAAAHRRRADVSWRRDRWWWRGRPASTGRPPANSR